MKPVLCALAALSLSACSTVGGSNQVLQNLEHCKRDYVVTVGAMGGGSATIHCEPKPWDSAPAAPVQ